MKTIVAIHHWWRNISQIALGILVVGSFVLFLIGCIWLDHTITLERNAAFMLAWSVLNLLRAS
jgi:biotin transporter BioY